jgi:thioredoxin reductase
VSTPLAGADSYGVTTRRIDIGVVGGGPAGLAAALWAGRYRRQVFLADAGVQRNRAATGIHGYLGFDGISPADFMDRARQDLRRYPAIEVRLGITVTSIDERRGSFRLVLSDGNQVEALRLILATGVRDLLPDLAGLDKFYGHSVFTCPSCDGYESRGRNVVVIGDDEHMAPFALGLLDWAGTVTVIVSDAAQRDRLPTWQALREHGIAIVTGVATGLSGKDRAVQAVHLQDGRTVACEVAYCTAATEQSSSLAYQLGCEITSDGCAVVDDEGRTTRENVFAAGDMTPGPQLVQTAAHEGTRAGIAAALSLRGVEGAPSSPRPAPDPDDVLKD